MPRRTSLSCVLSLLLLAAPALAEDFVLASPELQAGGRLTLRHAYDSYGCNGGNVSPALTWSGAPAGTRSYALTLFDPDAPHGFWHWVIFDVPATLAGLPAGAGEPKQAPKGALQGTSDFGDKGYGGPCPPNGDRPHRYVFTLYALKVERLGADASAQPAWLAARIRANALAEASLTVYYAR
ncbi:MAG TPA: YbhB/YbcL family Raf kinase inhibitor-like protein [Steroidobacteraceae bacterium]|nr:YbhB/YbcL family Raf kinase inhibitor-like protein [Steroidobacteraceae bacterium]